MALRPIDAHTSSEDELQLRLLPRLRFPTPPASAFTSAAANGRRGEELLRPIAAHTSGEDELRLRVVPASAFSRSSASTSAAAAYSG